MVSTYQSVSGAGQPGMHELDEQWTKGAGQAERLRRAGALDGAIEPGEVWDRPIAGNVIPLAGSVKEAGYTSEEWKLVHESRKILHAPELRVTRHVRAGARVRRARRRANVEFRGRCRAPRRSSCSRRAPGVQLVDGGDGAPHAARGRGHRPGARRAGCARTRRRRDTLDLWVTGDNLRKGAALNAVQLAELLLESDSSSSSMSTSTARCRRVDADRDFTGGGVHAVERHRAAPPASRGTPGR